MNRGAAQVGHAVEAAATIATNAALGFVGAGASAVASGFGAAAGGMAKALSGEAGFFDETVTVRGRASCACCSVAAPCA